jgi:hypothetical protein
MSSEGFPLSICFGELDICGICDGSPHEIGCPRHSDYDNESKVYQRFDEPAEVGPARFWVAETYALAALDAGLSKDEALAEGLQEFTLALQRRELRRVIVR